MKEAWALTHGDRREAYGDARQTFSAYAMVWSGLLRQKLKPGVTISAEDVTLMMAALKLCRESNAPRRDNVVDAHGYLVLHAEILGESQS